MSPEHGTLKPFLSRQSSRLSGFTLSRETTHRQRGVEGKTISG